MKKSKILLFYVKGSSNYHAIPFNNALKVTRGPETKISRIYNLTHLLCIKHGWFLFMGLIFFIILFVSLFLFKILFSFEFRDGFVFRRAKMSPRDNCSFRQKFQKLIFIIFKREH
jgi:hypothetical protein